MTSLLRLCTAAGLALALSQQPLQLLAASGPSVAGDRGAAELQISRRGGGGGGRSRGGGRGGGGRSRGGGGSRGGRTGFSSHSRGSTGSYRGSRTPSGGWNRGSTGTRQRNRTARTGIRQNNRTDRSINRQGQRSRRVSDRSDVRRRRSDNWNRWGGYPGWARPGWGAARPWNYGWYGGWSRPSWGWWGASAAAWGITTLTTAAIINSAVDNAINNQTTYIIVPNTDYRLLYGTVEPINDQTVSFAVESGASELYFTADCDRGTLNGRNPSTATEAELLNAACQVAFGST